MASSVTQACPDLMSSVFIREEIADFVAVSSAASKAPGFFTCPQSCRCATELVSTSRRYGPVSVSVTRRCSIKRDEQINLIFTW